MKTLIPVILLSSMHSLPVFADGNDQHHDAKGSTPSAKQQHQELDMDVNMMKKKSNDDTNARYDDQNG